MGDFNMSEIGTMAPIAHIYKHGDEEVDMPILAFTQELNFTFTQNVFSRTIMSLYPEEKLSADNKKDQIRRISASLSHNSLHFSRLMDEQKLSNDNKRLRK